ncbi:MAG TPA: phospholipase D-like domain-containing protein [Bryobacteraceae bacterium]|jgi:phosphatidylserine/phosphatidylglycerophosphate/cardiolipin synthase-like enzyme
MRNAVAFANNDIATIAWSYGVKPEGCMGFAVYRIDSKGNETALPSHAVFPGDTIKAGQTTAEFPIQKFYWKDLLARLEGDRTGNYMFRYKVVPLEGPSDKLVPMASLPILTTNEVTISGVCSASVTAIFNRGIISTQHVSNALKGKVSKTSLLAAIKDPANQLRKDLAGDMIETLTGFVARAKTSGSIYAALYELTDVELVQSLVGIGNKLNIVLANIVGKPAKGGSDEVPGENDDSETELKASAASLLYRKPASSHIVHNKFLIYVDKSGVPQAVLTGSCNWTDTGLCAQTNNAIVIDDKLVAARYMAYWKKLQTDETKHEAGGPFQDAPLRTFDGTGKDLTLDKGTDDASTLTSYFSPNTPKARSSSKKGTEAFPVDMKDLSDRIMAAKNAVLFLAFIPGTPSITEFAAAAQKANKDLFVRGCLTSPASAGNFYYDLKGTSPPKTQKGVKSAPAPQDPRVISANALDKTDIPEGWQKELLSAGFAITHDKIVVIDPFADDCVVVTGSHNLGYQASYNNDENLVMISGNKKLAMAYATHVLDVYDHFSWRWTVNNGTSVDAHLKTKPDDWLSWYFDAKGNIKTAQLKFWMQATV